MRRVSPSRVILAIDGAAGRRVDRGWCGAGRSASSVLLVAGLLAWVVGCASVGQGQSPTANQPWTIVQMCDPQFGMVDYAADASRFDQAVTQINALKPDFVFICGDLVNKPNRRSLGDFLAAKAKFQMPCYCAPGNHDVRDLPTAQSLALYRDVMGRDYFSVEQGDSVFVFVNTQLWKVEVPGESDRHDAWFRATLETAAAQGRRLFVIGHIPVFSMTPDEPDGHDNLPIRKRREVLELCHRCGVQAYLAGHSHRTRRTDYFGMEIVQSETTSLNFDFHPYGFRLWHVGATPPYTNEFVLLRWSASATHTNLPAPAEQP